MSGSTALVKEGECEMLEGLGEEILNLVTDQHKLSSTVWGDWLAIPFEEAWPYGDERLASVLLKAGAKGFGLQQATRSGHRRVVSELLQLGASPDSKDESGDAALHVAAQLGHAPIIKTLLIEGADMDHVDEKGRSPLHLASMKGDVPSVLTLLAAGADLALRFPFNEHSISALDVAAWFGRVRVLQILIERGAMSTVQAMKRTPLHFAAHQNQVAAIQLLVQEGASMNDKDAEGYTALLLATVENHAPAVQALCGLGADLSLRVKTYFCFWEDDFAALDLAAYYGWTDIMEVLIQHGSDVNARSSLRNQSALCKAAEGNEVGAIDVLIEAGAVITGPAGFDSALHLAVEGKAIQAIHALVRHGADPHWSEELNDTPLLRAVTTKHLGTVNALLAAGASPNISGTTNTVLFASVYPPEFGDCCPDIVQTLLAHGAQVDALSSEGVEGGSQGQTALHAAASWTHDHVVDMLVEAGATVRTPCTYGRTPLHEASSYQKLDTVAALLRHGAPINAQDNEGNTALHLAATGHEQLEDAMELVNCLLIAGADETIMNNEGKTPASHIPLEPTAHRPSDLIREQVRELLLRAPQDRADRAWRRRGMAFLCHAFPEKARRGNRATKLPRVAEVGRAAAGTVGEGRIDGDDNFRGMMENLFCLREGKEDIFRQIIALL